MQVLKFILVSGLAVVAGAAVAAVSFDKNTAVFFEDYPLPPPLFGLDGR